MSKLIYNKTKQIVYNQTETDSQIENELETTTEKKEGQNGVWN